MHMVPNWWVFILPECDQTNICAGPYNSSHIMSTAIKTGIHFCIINSKVLLRLHLSISITFFL